VDIYCNEIKPHVLAYFWHSFLYLCI
jgi:hypothetical protein